MIRKIDGTLEGVVEGSARVRLGHGLTYEVLVPAFSVGRLTSRVGSEITLHTTEFLEGAAQGSVFVPRLAGFPTEEDLAFYEIFTTVKGIGPRKALRALALSTEQIAGAIAERDVKTVQSLPEIGRRMAETIVTSLNGRVDRFLAAPAPPPAAEEGEGTAPSAPGHAPAREALEVLVQLGENRSAAVASINDVLNKNPALSDSQEILTEVFRNRGTGAA